MAIRKHRKIAFIQPRKEEKAEYKVVDDKIVVSHIIEYYYDKDDEDEAQERLKEIQQNVESYYRLRNHPKHLYCSV